MNKNPTQTRLSLERPATMLLKDTRIHDKTNETQSIIKRAMR